MEDTDQFFLPKSFSAVMTEDIEKINTNAVSLYLAFTGE
jgi:hypothetical protein